MTPLIGQRRKTVDDLLSLVCLATGLLILWFAATTLIEAPRLNVWIVTGGLILTGLAFLAVSWRGPMWLRALFTGLAGALFVTFTLAAVLLPGPR